MDDDIILYTVEDIQRIFKVRRTKAYQILASQSLPTIKIGRSRYVTKADLQNFIKQNRNKEIKL